MNLIVKAKSSSMGRLMLLSTTCSPWFGRLYIVMRIAISVVRFVQIHGSQRKEKETLLGGGKKCARQNGRLRCRTSHISKEGTQSTRTRQLWFSGSLFRQPAGPKHAKRGFPAPKRLDESMICSFGHCQTYHYAEIV